jgi:transcriptional regulator with XRE-family HTH domain
MNSNETMTSTAPLHIFLRQRRTELKLLQTQIAEAVGVSPECVTLWEAGRRRMELSKLPRIAQVLQIDAKSLCARALAEFHPLFYHALFGNGAGRHSQN